MKRECEAEEWEHFKLLVKILPKSVPSAKEKYFLKLGQRLLDPAWSTLNEIINRYKVTNIPHLLRKWRFVTNYQTKADVFKEFFAKQYSLRHIVSSIPAFSPKCAKILSSIGTDRSKVLLLILFLDSKKAHGCDHLPIAMLKICHFAIVEPLSLICEKCVDQVNTAHCGRK